MILGLAVGKDIISVHDKNKILEILPEEIN